ncbi:MAG: hypothetical protein P8176_11355 [Gammaproteobacteria bacterium]
MSSINNAGQQPRLRIDLNVEYRAEDDDALNDDRVGESGTPPAERHEAGRCISQIRVMSDSAQTSFSMRHSVPQAQTSLRAPRDQAIDAGKIVVSIENANQRISVTSSLPRASSSEVRFAPSGSQSGWLCFASSSIAPSTHADAGQPGETSERRIPKNAPRYPVPMHLRRPGETDETRVAKRILSKRELVLVPEGLRLEGETDQTRISRNALSLRNLKKGRVDEKKYPVPMELRRPGETDETRVIAATLSMRRLVSVPEALRIAGETDQTRLSRNALLRRRRQWVSVPPEFRFQGETDDTRIRYTTLTSRKKLVLIPESLREPSETENTKITRFILQNRKRERAAEQSSVGIKKSKRTE